MQYVIQNLNHFNMAQLIIRLPDKDKQTLQLIAEKKALNISNLIRSLINDFLQEQAENSNILLELSKISDPAIKADPQLSTTYKKTLYQK